MQTQVKCSPLPTGDDYNQPFCHNEALESHWNHRVG